MSKMKRFKILKIFLIIISSSALLLAVYFLPPVHSRLSWRLASLRADIYYLLNPPGAVAFSPGQQDIMEDLLSQTQTAMAQQPTATVEPTIAPTDLLSPTPTITQTPLPTTTPLPDVVQLKGILYEEQLFNNCGPANLSMTLSYWGWEGDQRVAGAWLKPRQDDRNVMPYEMVEFVRSQTRFNAMMRHGGDMDLLKELIAAGFPVIVEKGYEVDVHGWMGHYGTLNGYDEHNQFFIMQDSYDNKYDYQLSYEELKRQWRAFNYIYIVVYPFERESEVYEILGPRVDETYSFELAAEIAREEKEVLEGRDLFFAWFNYGTSQRNLLNYYGAAQAFDYAFQEVYENLNLPRIELPWRLMWYQTDPYFAYYHTGRYQDVIDLANQTFSDAAVNAIEESWVWRGRAKLALGDREGAINDFRAALEWHPGWWVAINELNLLGETP